MPYIKPSDKKVYESGIALLAEAFASVAAGDGDLNYVLTKIVLTWLEYHQPPYGYSLRADGIKALECAKLEYYRRVLIPYECDKIETNGDVYNVFALREGKAGSPGKGEAPL